MKRLINIFFNDNIKSLEAFIKTKELFEKRGFEVSETFKEEAELSICIGGDGAFLRGVHNSDFPKVPFVGINTGTLGFFQEISFDKIEKFIDDYIDGKYIVEKITLLTVLIPPTIRNDKNSLDKNIFNFDGLYSFHSISSFPLIIIALSASSASGVSESESE